MPVKPPMSRPTRPMAKIRRISIRNYKGIENLELELPGPRMREDPDVMVIGSQNGLGKTSILECCSLLLSTLTTRQKQWTVGIPNQDRGQFIGRTCSFGQGRSNLSWMENCRWGARSLGCRRVI